MILPCILGDGDNRLRRLKDAIPRISVAIWVASHPDLADVPRIRTASEAISETLRANRAALLGWPD